MPSFCLPGGLACTNVGPQELIFFAQFVGVYLASGGAVTNLAWLDCRNLWRCGQSSGGDVVTNARRITDAQWRQRV